MTRSKRPISYTSTSRTCQNSPKFSVVHLPKTIDNDYNGIDFTFRFFTAVDFMAKEALNLRADAKATSSWFIIETMGRKAGWLPYGVAIARLTSFLRQRISMKASDCERWESVEYGCTRRSHHGPDRDAGGAYKQAFGTIVLAEGLAEMLP